MEQLGRQNAKDLKSISGAQNTFYDLEKQKKSRVQKI